MCSFAMKKRMRLVFCRWVTPSTPWGALMRRGMESRIKGGRSRWRKGDSRIWEKGEKEGKIKWEEKGSICFWYSPPDPPHQKCLIFSPCDETDLCLPRSAIIFNNDLFHSWTFVNVTPETSSKLKHMAYYAGLSHIPCITYALYTFYVFYMFSLIFSPKLLECKKTIRSFVCLSFRLNFD